LSPFFAPSGAAQPLFYNFAGQNASKMQTPYSPCRSIAVYTERRPLRTFPPVENSVESVKKMLYNGLFHRFNQVFNNHGGQIFHITARINPFVNPE
jgi:hypothetical protein